MPAPVYLPPMLLLGPAIAALLVYAVLRWVIWAPGTGTSPGTVSQHGLWVGVIGWLTSSLQGAMTLGIIPANPSSNAPLVSAEAIIPALAWPVLGCLTVHALGQVSYPGPRRMRRQAVLSLRRINDFLPRRLALTTAAIFVSAATAIARAATVPGSAAVAPTTVSDGQDSYNTGGGEGRIPGPETAAWLGGALLVLAVGTWLVLWLIARRRQLESLDAADNAVLRTIAMNRLLRTVSTVAAGLALIAANFASRPDPDPGQGPASWTNFAGLAAIVVLFVMWWWRPPRLTAGRRGDPNRQESGSAACQQPAARLVSSLGALLGLAAAVPLVAGIFLAESLMAGADYGFAGLVALTAASVLLAIAAGEFLLQRNYGNPEAPRGWPRHPLSPALLTTAGLALFFFLAVLGVTAVGQARLSEGPGWVPAGLFTAGACAASVPAFFSTRYRQGIRDAPRGLDAALRAITLHRVVRTLAATFLAQAGLLLLTQGNAWPAVLGGSGFGETDPAAGLWGPATVAGSALVAAAVVIAVIPVRTVARAPYAPAPRPEPEAAT